VSSLARPAGSRGCLAEVLIVTRAKGGPLLWAHHLEDLEQRLVEQLYVLRSLEDAIGACSGAPSEGLLQSCAAAQQEYRQIELQIRRLRHGY